jgi:hypothetical protein
MTFAASFKRLKRFLDLRSVPRPNDYAGSRIGKTQSDGLAEAARAAGHYRNPAGDVKSAKRQECSPRWILDNRFAAPRGTPPGEGRSAIHISVMDAREDGK